MKQEAVLNMMGVLGKTLLMAAITLVGVSSSASAQIVNGGFEDNNGAGFPGFANWTSVDQAGSAGSFYAQTGTGSPLFGNLVPPPPEGSVAAMSEGGGAGSHVLYQDFVGPVGLSNVRLSFAVFVGNQAGDFFTPATLDFSGAANQQARVDLLLANSDPFSVAGGDILLTLFQTQAGDPLTSGYTLVNTDITSLLAANPGQTLRLRFAEVDNIAPLNFGVDSVHLVVPEPSVLALLLAGGLSGGGLLLRRRMRK